MANSKTHTPETELKILEIMELMRSWQWVKRKTAQDLAAKWGVGVDWVEDLSAIASKRVRAEVTDPGEVSMTVGVALSKVLHDAMDEGDKKSVIDSAKVWAQIVGAMAPQRHEVTEVQATPQMAQRLVREAFGQVTPSLPESDSDLSESGD